MKDSLQMELAVIGGDSRQLAVAEALADLGANVNVFGHPQEQLSDKIHYCEELSVALFKVKAVVLPISGINDAGLIRSSGVSMIDFGQYFESLSDETLLITGSLASGWKQIAHERKYRVYEYAEDNTVAILNSIPTAEGAVQLAMEMLPITIHNANVLIIGFGRIGITVARTFKALGGRVTVAARRSELLARAEEMGCETVDHQNLAAVFGDANIIINTVPAIVVARSLLTLMSPDALIIDLASSPGGIDFEAAKELNRNAILAPGLPGKVAPKTAGAILASAIPDIIGRMIEDGGDR